MTEIKHSQCMFKHEASINLNLLRRWRALACLCKHAFLNIDVTQSSARCVNFPAMHIANMKQNKKNILFTSLSLSL